MEYRNLSEIHHHMTPETMESFVASEAAKGASVNMLRRFNGTVRAVYAFLPSDKLLTKERLQAWRCSMEEKKYASATIQNYVKYINRYLAFAGCSEIRFNRGKSKDIANQTFGYLTAIRPTGARNRGDVVWLCRCECGNTAELPATRLLLGNTSSCGCLQKQHRKEVFPKANKTFGGTNLTQALKERVVSTRNASGYVGVFRKRNKWTATIGYRGHLYYLGTYCDIEDAVKARARAKELAMEDAEGLLAFYEELHESAPALTHKRNEVKIHTECIEQNTEPAPSVKRTNNTSGCVGVVARKKRWEARICYRRVRYVLGVFEKIEDAISARKKAEADLKANPQEFVCVYSAAFANHMY